MYINLVSCNLAKIASLFEEEHLEHISNFISFPICIPSNFCPCLTVPARNCSTMLESVMGWDILTLLIIWGEKLQVYHLKHDVGCFCVCSLSIWGSSLCPLYFAANFVNEYLFDMVKGFSCLYWYNHIILLAYLCDKFINWFSNVEPSLHVWDKSRLL